MNAVWKNPFTPYTQPIVAIEIEPDRWIITGGTYIFKRDSFPTYKEEDIERIFGKFSVSIRVYVYTGDIRENSESMQYIDFVFPYVAGQTSLDVTDFGED